MIARPLHSTTFSSKCQTDSINSTNMTGVITIYELFVGKIAEQKKLQKKTNADIADMTGYKKKTIEAFLGSGRQTEKVAEAIAKALKIEM